MRCCFPRSAVSVHHGSVGTVVAAFRAGVPKLAAPLRVRPALLGTHVKALGDGDSMVLGELTVPVLARALQRLLSSSDVHEGVARVRPEMPCSARTAEGHRSCRCECHARCDRLIFNGIAVE